MNTHTYASSTFAISLLLKLVYQARFVEKDKTLILHSHNAFAFVCNRYFVCFLKFTLY